MHDTAFLTARLFFDCYCSGPDRKILEVGSYTVNGHWTDRIRDLAPEGCEYVGVDIEAGPNVDLVVEAGGRLPFDDETFDAVIASSVFEHDEAFWVTFLELVRVAKLGGYIYISAPSNGVFHQYPFDNWRFYPDAGLALAKWSKKSGYEIVLCESFIAERNQDIWNDFCAVFCKAADEPVGERKRISSVVPSSNIRQNGAAEIANYRTWTEDMVLCGAMDSFFSAADPHQDPNRPQGLGLLGRLSHANQLLEEALR
ncbi:MAG: methyltransferase type 11 [Rhizobiales bacterium PAR1]|nr:MAG: methyltransferase type 11 [Rhizobiales bacterium PAR1]